MERKNPDLYIRKNQINLKQHLTLKISDIIIDIMIELISNILSYITDFTGTAMEIRVVFSFFRLVTVWYKKNALNWFTMAHS